MSVSRSFLALGFAVCLSAALACSGGGGSGDSTEVVVALPSDNPGDIKTRQQMADTFMKQHPDIPVKVLVIPASGYGERSRP